MKIYVAGRTSMVEQVREVQRRVRECHHEVSYDWTQNVEKEGGAADHSVRPDVRRAYAEADRRGVLEAQAVIAVAGPRWTGTLIEIGMALALNKRVVLLGHPEVPSVFYDLPEVINLDNLAELTETLIDALFLERQYDMTKRRF